MTERPIFRTLGFFATMLTRKPAVTAKSAYFPRLNEIICMEMVVPMLAPSTTGTAWVRLIRPALMNPTTMTVVALLWTSVAISVPRPIPDSLRVVMTESTLRSFWPAASRRPSDMMFMPKMKSARPPRIWNTRKNSLPASIGPCRGATKPMDSTRFRPALDTVNWMKRSAAGLAVLARV